MSEKFDCIVVGAGISGITCAGYLAKAGKKTLVVEKLSEVGGVTAAADVMGCKVSMNIPLVSKDRYGDANGWAKAAQDFGADVRVVNCSVPRIYLAGSEKPPMPIPICLSPEGAAKWMTEILSACRPDLMEDDIEQALVPIMREIYETPVERMTVKWDEMPVKDWITSRTDKKGIHFVFNMMMTVSIYTSDADYTWNYANVGKGLEQFRIWISGDGKMAIPLPNTQYGICVPLAEAIRKNLGCEIRLNQEVKKVIIEDGRAKGIEIKGKNGEIQKIFADDVVVSTRWVSYSSVFDPMPAFLEEIVKQASSPEHYMGGAFITFILNNSIKLDGAYFLIFDAKTGTNILGGCAQSTEQPWNAPEGKQFIWIFKILTGKEYEKLGLDRIGVEMKTHMETMFPGFSDALVWESPVQGRHAPTHFYYNSQPKVRHSYPAIKHLYFAGDCTYPMYGLLTDGASSTGFITAMEILGIVQPAGI